MEEAAETQDTGAETCPHQDAVFWNPYNHVVQCHRCGTIFGPWDYATPLPESITPRVDVNAKRPAPRPMADDELAPIIARMFDALVLPPGMTEESLQRIHDAWNDRAALIAAVWRLSDRAAQAREEALDEVQEFVVAHTFDTTAGRRIDDFITSLLAADKGE